MEQWREERYLLHSRLPVHRRRIDRAQTVIKEVISRFPGIWSVACSGGKDSTVLLDLCVAAGWSGPILHFHYKETPPENRLLVQSLAERYGLSLHELEVCGAWDVFDSLGHAFACPRTDAEKKATGRMLRGYKKEIDRYVTEQGWTGQFWGLRQTESRQRSYVLRSGAIYRTKDRSTWTACPLRDWSVEDVFAYALTHNLPLLEAYHAARNPERQRSEETYLASDGLWRYGMMTRLKLEQPDRYREIVCRYPELASWT